MEVQSEEGGPEEENKNIQIFFSQMLLRVSLGCHREGKGRLCGISCLSNELLLHPVVASCSPGPLTLPFADFQLALLCSWSDVLMQMYNRSEPSLYNAVEEVIKTYL